MSFLYCTADAIGTQTGGGVVTHHESEALWELGKELGQPCFCWQHGQLNFEHLREEPWRWDQAAFDSNFPSRTIDRRLAHFYSGTFSKTVKQLKDVDCKIAYTIAAHDKDISREEHEKLGLPFPYAHLTDPELWKRYIEGYRLADVIICPGKHAADIVRNYGPEFKDKRIEIIPHGCELPDKIAPLPQRFTVGYMGSMGADKGVRYLLEAWRNKDGFLKIAGKDSNSPWGWELVNRFGAGNVWMAGWQENVSDFYNSISLYVQPSATEGFGIEVIEAMAHGRPVLCSENAGAADLVPDWYRFKARDVETLSDKISDIKQKYDNTGVLNPPNHWRAMAEKYTWDKIRERYKEVWRSLL